MLGFTLLYPTYNLWGVNHEIVNFADSKDCELNSLSIIPSVGTRHAVSLPQGFHLIKSALLSLKVKDNDRDIIPPTFLFRQVNQRLHHLIAGAN